MREREWANLKPETGHYLQLRPVSNKSNIVPAETFLHGGNSEQSRQSHITRIWKHQQKKQRLTQCRTPMNVWICDFLTIPPLRILKSDNFTLALRKDTPETVGLGRQAIHLLDQICLPQSPYVKTRMDGLYGVPHTLIAFISLWMKYRYCTTVTLYTYSNTFVHTTLFQGRNIATLPQHYNCQTSDNVERVASSAQED